MSSPLAALRNKISQPEDLGDIPENAGPAAGASAASIVKPAVRMRPLSAEPSTSEPASAEGFDADAGDFAGMASATEPAEEIQPPVSVQAAAMADLPEMESAVNAKIEAQGQSHDSSVDAISSASEDAELSPESVDVEAQPVASAERQIDPETGVVAFDTSYSANDFIYKGVNDLPNVVTNLLESAGIPEDKRAEIKAGYIDYLVDGKESLLRANELDKLDGEEMQRLTALEASASAMNRGGLTSLISTMFRPGINPAQEKAKVQARMDQRRRDLAEKRTQFHEVQRDRIVKVKKDYYVNHMLDLASRIDGLGRSVRNYNDTFVQSSPELLRMVEQRAKDEGVDPSVVMDEIAHGRAPKDVMSEFERVKAQALQNEVVKKAYEDMIRKENSVRLGFEDAVKQAETLHAATGGVRDEFDIEECRTKLTSEAASIASNMPKPIAETGKDMAQRMHELSESISERFLSALKTISDALERMFSSPKM